MKPIRGTFALGRLLNPTSTVGVLTGVLSTSSGATAFARDAPVGGTVGRLLGDVDGRLVRELDGWLDGQPVGGILGKLDGWLDGPSVGRLLRELDGSQ